LQVDDVSSIECRFDELGWLSLKIKHATVLGLCRLWVNFALFQGIL
jgi:hypothetical protein